LKFLSIGDTTVAIINEGDNSPDIKYSLNGGKKWVRWDYSPINLQDGDSIYFKGDNPSGFSVSSSEYSHFSLSGDGMIAASGDITSLLDDGVCNTLIIPREYYFWGLFAGCSSLTTAPELPATTLTSYCYESMFNGCTSLTTAPELPATTLAQGCYSSMFVGCTSLTTAPELPATTLAQGCYSSMFGGCTSLTTAPELPAATLAIGCYQSMFASCTSLTTAPELSATTLANYCYYSMFQDCSSLTEAPELPATALTTRCYFRMFAECSNLVVAPELPAETLGGACYVMMFINCTKLSYIKCLALNPQGKFMSNWVAGVASSGTFVKNAIATGWTTGNSGIPNGWTVEDDSQPIVVDNCSVFVVSYDTSLKMSFIRTIRAITGLGLKEAKNFVDSIPKTLMDSLSLEEARNIAQQIYDCEAQGSCDIRDSNETIIEKYYH